MLNFLKTVLEPLTSIFRVGFALSKTPHLHRTYLVTVRNDCMKKNTKALLSICKLSFVVERVLKLRATHCFHSQLITLKENVSNSFIFGLLISPEVGKK